MYTKRITLEKALELEAVGEIVIVSTHEDDHSHEREAVWRSNFEDLRERAVDIPLYNIFKHYPTKYLIEQSSKYCEETNSTTWRYFRGIKNTDTSLISEDNVEYVYVLVNKDYPDLVKIGMTVKSPEKRLSGINSTGVVTHWNLAFALPLKPGSSLRVEQQVHALFSSRRHHAENINDKEMFFVSLPEAIDEVRRIGQFFTTGPAKFYT
jgi:hypothetical protein